MNTKQIFAILLLFFNQIYAQTFPDSVKHLVIDRLYAPYKWQNSDIAQIHPPTGVWDFYEKTSDNGDNSLYVQIDTILSLLPTEAIVIIGIYNVNLGGGLIPFEGVSCSPYTLNYRQPLAKKGFAYIKRCNQKWEIAYYSSFWRDFHSNIADFFIIKENSGIMGDLLVVQEYTAYSTDWGLGGCGQKVLHLYSLPSMNEIFSTKMKEYDSLNIAMPYLSRSIYWVYPPIQLHKGGATEFIPFIYIETTLSQKKGKKKVKNWYYFDCGIYRPYKEYSLIPHYTYRNQTLNIGYLFQPILPKLRKSVIKPFVLNGNF